MSSAVDCVDWLDLAASRRNTSEYHHVCVVAMMRDSFICSSHGVIVSWQCYVVDVMFLCLFLGEVWLVRDC